MNAADLARTIQEQARPLVESLYSELRSNLGTSHYHRLSNDELLRRGQAVYLRLAEWLTSADDGIVTRSGAELGKKRFTEGIPLGQVVLALILEEKHLWEYLENAGVRHTEDDLRRHVSDFFARTIYCTSVGYEQALAENSRRVRGDLTARQPDESQATRVPTTEEKQTFQISRGGEIGEVSG